MNRRFPDYEWLEKPSVANYLTGVWTYSEPSAGAYHHTTILLPGAYARRPLRDRITRLKVKSVGAIYGTNDWMDPQRFIPIMEEHHRRNSSQNFESQPTQSRQQTPEHSARGAGATICGADVVKGAQNAIGEDFEVEDLQFMLVDKAGHNVQVDNPLAFVAAMQAFVLRSEQCTGRTFVAEHFEMP